MARSAACVEVDSVRVLVAAFVLPHPILLQAPQVKRMHLPACKWLPVSLLHYAAT